MLVNISPHVQRHELRGFLGLDVVGMMVINGSIDFFHITRVPPDALDLISAMSGSIRSSEFR